MSAGRWGTDDAAVALSTFQEGLPVRLIATARNDLKVCRPDEDLSAVVARNREDNFDYFPVVECADENRERIIGLVELVPFMGGAGAEPRGLVRDQMRPLSEENLIGADASLLTFIRNADQQKCRLVVSGPEINGLVGLSDMQRLPVRAALFAMVTHLENVMVNAIRREFNRPEEWMDQLSPGRRKHVNDEVDKAKSEDMVVETLLFTQFCDKVAIIKESQFFQWSKTSFEDEFRRVCSLRNSLAHANNYAATREAAGGVCKTVKLMDMWIKRLEAWHPQTAAL